MLESAGRIWADLGETPAETAVQALTAAGAIRIGNLSSVTDFSTFTQVLPRLSEQTWSVTDCSYNPTYQQMLDGETGAESK